MKLNALKPVHINGAWVQKGQPVPADVAGYDYEAAARRGLIEEVDGGEIANLPSADQVSVPATASADPESDLQAALAEQRKEAERLSALLNETGAKVTDLTKERDDARARVTELRVEMEAAKADASALAEYREVVGELLPSDYPSRKILLDNGYYTVGTVAAATDDELNALDGIADKTLAAIRKVTPHAPAEGE